MDLPSLRRETRYGMPAADKILFNRYYVLGYSYYFRQAKWALEIIDPTDIGLDRMDNFRPDYRLPDMFRTDLEDYAKSGLDRGHLVASANQRGIALQNSETFLLSNMAPQRPQFNRAIWRELEEAVRTLNQKPRILETYVICGPLFYFDQPVEFIGADDDNEVEVPIPNAFFKSILTENDKGRLHMWSFILPNAASDKPLADYQVPTTKIEKYAGVQLWDRLEGSKILNEKKKIRPLW
ncbi:DNA/RNA non-specific endonuclease [Paremcibacter congregatus]|uniref:Endonuclease n=1 Tax=Paremcibacter congregatus TaxID=2043170 RepID=A0A2G4YM69_9PROT|nr:DNA/RNA non-specific endonuclease [Paremcibacter congregatus]PHZ83429.1 DNA/RNA endonuclease G [Paremcibacter congregatus]QDE28103.1 DNA/RNA endonuclease G [Paremcibacter congregatus]